MAFSTYPARHAVHIEAPFLVHATPALGVPLAQVHRFFTHLRELSVYPALHAPQWLTCIRCASTTN
eukprot:COSAG01_NODE_60250_length_295_cov_8.545918_1_plen_65_part_01